MATATTPTPATSPPEGAVVIGAGQMVYLPLGRLVTGTKNPYQRDLKPRKLEKMIAEWKPARIGVLEVVLRNNMYCVMGGQHRVEAMRSPELAERFHYSPDALVQCHMQIFDSLQEEAETALHMDKDRTSWNAYDNYRAGLVAKDPIAKGVEKILNELGIKVSPGQAQGQRKPVMFAIGTCMSIYARPGGPDLLQRTMSVLAQSWGLSDPKAYDATLVTAMASFFAHHWQYVDDDRLASVLKKADNTPDKVLTEARQMKKHYQWAVTAYGAIAIEIMYNFGRIKGKLRDVPASEYARALTEYSREWEHNPDRS